MSLQRTESKAGGAVLAESAVADADRSGGGGEGACESGGAVEGDAHYERSN